MKKLVMVSALALLLTVGIFTLGQQSKPAHAQTVKPQNQVQSQVTSEKPDTNEVSRNESSGKATPEATESKQTENDGPGGHQDSQGAYVDHQFDGVE